MEDALYRSHQQQVSSLTGGDAVELLGTLGEEAATRADEPVLTRLIAEADRIRTTVADTSEERAALEYYTGNALSSLHAISAQANGTVWAWDQPSLRQAIYRYRRALITAAPMSPSARGRAIQTMVNLGNAMSHIGRSFDAIEQYDRAEQLHPRFAMAVGNRGFALMHLARWLYDPSHRFLAMRKAWNDMRNAIAMPETLESHAGEGFRQAVAQIESVYGTEQLHAEPDWPQDPIGVTDDERVYRRWCYQHRLFLNDLADILPPTVSATDPTSLPSIVSPLKSPVQFYGLFNLMKQEFATARWLCFSGLTASQSHFADREVLIYDTLDYPCHAVAVEQARIGLRAAFSVLDKVGLFINAYWRLGHDESQVYFRSVWFVKRDPKKGLSPSLAGLQNWPLRGLFALSQDLADKDLQEVLDPASQSLQELRHKLEHQFVKVVEPISPALDPTATPRMLADPKMVVYLSRNDLEAKAIRVLQLVRRALLHLTMSVQAEEERRAHVRGDGRIGEIEMLSVPDDQKR
ncbi:MAG: LA2681 family HEPN domain-containing protein [Bacillota bacterium]